MSEASEHMPEREALAAEYVLGTLPLPERLAAEAMIASDVAFAALVEQWRDRLAPLNDAYGEAAPPPDLLGRIEARLFPAPERRRRPGWIWGAFAGIAAAAVAAVVFTAILPPAEAPGAISAELTAENQPLVIAARFDPAAGELTAERSAGPAAGPGSDYELWLIPKDQAPISLGIVRDAALRVALADLPSGATLAVTLEAAGGSPTGQPQGALLVAAVIAEGGGKIRRAATSARQLA
jgi:anti-sigma-K factor RskA